MALIFDTSVAISIRDQEPRILQLASECGQSIQLSILSVVELENGVVSAKIDRLKRRLALDEMYEAFEILPFGEDEARAYRGIVEALGFSRPKIIDRMIAAHGLVTRAAVATLNPRDFREVAALKIEDWSA